MIDCDLIRKKSNATLFSKNIICLDEVDSTNSFILKMAKDGAAEGTVVIAKYQKAGRGRHGRKWVSPSGQNLLFSILLRPSVLIEDAQKITLAVGDTLARTIKDYFAEQQWPEIVLEVKWPNDLLVDGKKISGILAESILSEKKVVALAIGIGLNINMTQEDFDGELKGKAASLSEFSGKPIVPEEILSLFLKNLEVYYEAWERTNYKGVVCQWKQNNYQTGKNIVIKTPTGEESVTFYDVDENGYLLYKREDGTLKQLVSGEIRCY